MNTLTRTLTALTAVALLGACNTATKTQDPRMELSDGVHAVTTAPHTSFTLHLSATPAALKGLDAADHSSSPLSDESIRQILGSSIHLSADAPKDKTGKDAAAALEVRVDNNDLFDARYVNQLVYLRADVTRIRTLAKVSDEQFAAVNQIGAQPGFEFVPAAVRGEWLKIDPKPLKDFAEGLSSKSSSGAPSPSMNPEEYRKVVQNFVDGVFSQDATVTRMAKGGDGDHLRVDVPIQKVYTRFQGLYPQLTKGFPGADTKTLPPVSSVPARTLHFDVYVSHNALTRVDFDLTQLSPKPVTTGPVSVRVDITRPSTGISAPEKSTEVNLVRLIGQFAGAFGGAGHSPFGGNTPAPGLGAPGFGAPGAPGAPAPLAPPVR